MTGNEKYDPRLRIYHAEAPLRPKRRAKFPYGAVIPIAAAALLFAYDIPEPYSADKLTGFLCGIASASAYFDFGMIGFSVSMPEIPEAPPNETRKAVNNNPDISALREEDMLMLSRGSRHMPSSADEEREVTDSPAAPFEGDFLSAFPDNDGAIRQITYQMGRGESYIDLPMGGQLRNVTSLSADKIRENALLLPEYKIKLDAPDTEPQILIMHTHTTESYEPDERGYYDKDYIGRTTDDERNMNAVGKVMAEVFEEKGIRTVHDTTVHDHPSYNGSYDRSRETVKTILEKYPSIKVVLDVHRDAIEHENGERIAPTAVINGQSCAQVMIICGCDDGTMGMPDCMKNLRTASLFEQYMESRYKGLTRPVLYDYRKYNQDLTTGSLLIEIGGHANSLPQALLAGRLTADSIADALIENCT